jgi:hypothetical protein
VPPLSFPLPTPATRAHTPHPLNTVTPSIGCSSTGTPSPRQNLAGEPPRYSLLVKVTLHPSSSLLNWPPSPPSPERRRPRRNAIAPPHPPPHRCPTPLVSRATILLARWLPLTVLVLTPPTALHGSPRRALAGRATAPPRTWPPHGDHAKRACRDGWHGLAGPLGQANSAGPQARKLTSYYSAIFWFFISVYYFRNSYKLQKSVENTILLRKIWDKFLYTP